MEITRQQHRRTVLLHHLVHYFHLGCCHPFVSHCYRASLKEPLEFSSATLTLFVLFQNVSGHTKRSAANAMFLAGYASGQIAAPLTYPPTEAPQFPTGFLVTLVCLIVSVGLMGLYWYVYSALRLSTRHFEFDD